MVGGNTFSSDVIKMEQAARGSRSAGFDASRCLYEYQSHLVHL